MTGVASAGRSAPISSGRPSVVAGGRVAATPATLSQLASRIGADGDSLLELRRRTAWALAELRAASDEPGVRLTPEPVDDRIELVASAVDRLRTTTLDVAEAIGRADCWVWPTWWFATTTALRWADDVADVRPEELPGLGGLPAPETIAAMRGLWSVTRAWDAAGPRRLAGRLAVVAGAGRRQVSAVTDAAARLWPRSPAASLPGRVAEVLQAPVVRRAGRALGRVGGGLGVAVDAVDTAERLVAGDGWGAARSAASGAGGVAMLVGGPVTIAIGATVVAGVFVYENRAAIAAGARRAQRAARGAAARAGSAVSVAGGELVGAGGAMLDGARRVLDGLF